MKPFPAAPAAGLGLVLFLAACGGAAPASAPATPQPRATVDVAAAASAIAADAISRDIHALAHDTMRGRDTPSPELEKAADFLARRFRQAGLEPAGDDGSFIHRWTWDRVVLRPENVTLSVRGASAAPARYGRDYFLIPAEAETTEGRAIYVGRAGQVRALPQDARGGILFFDIEGADADEDMQMSLVAGIQTAMMNGAAGVIGILDPEFPAHLVGQFASAVAAQSLPVPVIGITAAAARDLIAAAGGDLDALRDGGAPRALDATVAIQARQTQEQHTPPNVIAMLPGSDPALRGSYVVLTAHFDHVGIGAPDERGDSIYSGADDNASGTSALLAIAEAMARLPTAPARSVLFLAVSGEEHGLLGSTAWVEEPTVPIDDVVANINMDMIGRNAPDTIVGIGQEYSNLQGVLAEITAGNPELGLNVILDPEPEKMFFFRSDQLPFIRAGIPAVFFTTSEHDDYHRPSDLADRIDTDKVARVARLAFHLAYAIADDPQAPEYTTEGWRQIQQILEASPF